MTTQAAAIAGDILSTAATLLRGAASAVPQPWGIVLSALAAGAGLGADLAAHGLDPVGTIEEMRSLVPGIKAADGRLADYLAARAQAPQ